MVKQLQSYSLGILVLGIGMLKQGVQRADLTWLIGGFLTLSLGIFGLIYGRWHNLGWLLVGLGGSLILVGTAESSTLWGYAFETPNTILVVGGAALAMAGMALVGLSYTTARRGQVESGHLQHSSLASTLFPFAR